MKLNFLATLFKIFFINIRENIHINPILNVKFNIKNIYLKKKRNQNYILKLLFVFKGKISKYSLQRNYFKIATI